MAQRIGILGAGQLGGYLCSAAAALNLTTTVLANNANEMAVSLADDALFETDDAVADALELASRCDYITFEKEDVAPEVLNALRKQELAGSIHIAPSVDTMLLLQNKALQKRWLCDKGLPTAEYIEVETNATTADLRKRMGSPFVVKSERGGYDGLGVRVINDDDPIENLGTVPSIAERYIDDRREIAVLVVRTEQADTIAYPAVEMVFDPEGNLLRTILAPATLSTELMQQAEALSVSAINHLGSAGVFAVELFYADNTLLINEISPRVHNSGHHTLDASPTSQFEQHIRALTGLELGAIEPMQPAALINLLCEPELHNVCCSDQQSTQEAPDVFVHWYGKKTRRHLRKMGHLTALDSTAGKALNRAQAHYTELVSTKTPTDLNASTIKENSL